LDLALSIFSYKLIIEYKGTFFFGWQVQSDHLTIQGQLNKALEQISKSKNIKSLGAGRTDAKVHAFAQVAKVDIPIKLPAKALLKGINSLVGDGIRVKECTAVSSDFHPIRDSLWKEYNYLFTRDTLISPCISDLIAPVGSDLNMSLIQEACKVFVGEHNFKNFYCTGSEFETTVKTILECEILKESQSGFFSNFLPEYYILRVKGTGFLKQMVRLMAGTLFEIGKGKVSINDLERSLAGELDRKLGSVAPPQGLYLKEIKY